MKKTTILHLSDLHRDAGSRIGTNTLLSSLVRDRNRYTQNEGVPNPDLAVISGDIVYGVKGEDRESDLNLQAQYDEAYETLSGLADRFFDGDREKVIIAPGNHDVSMPHFLRSLRRVETPADDDKRRLIVQKLMEPDSVYRFSLSQMAIFEIVNPSVYAQRLEPYANFYERFYEGRRKFSLNPEEQYSIHEFPSLGITIVTFSSCLENDLYNRTGSISPEAISRAMDEVSNSIQQGSLLLSVWHHSIQGGPKENDYMDPDFIKILMDSDCSIGMHGHQHRTGMLENKFSPDVQKHIAVISAGTLCGGPRALPVGRMRAYNVVVLDQESAVGTIYVRAMSNSDFSSPVWERGHVNEFGGSSINFKLYKAPVRPSNPLQLAAQADELIRQGKSQEAYELIKCDTADIWVREVAIRALSSIPDWISLSKLVEIPASSIEFVLLCEAYEALMDWSSLRSLLSSEYAVKFGESLAVRVQIERSQLLLRGK